MLLRPLVPRPWGQLDQNHPGDLVKITALLNQNLYILDSEVGSRICNFDKRLVILHKARVWNFQSNLV